jgi:hypothetical protein
VPGSLRIDNPSAFQVVTLGYPWIWLFGEVVRTLNVMERVPMPRTKITNRRPSPNSHRAPRQKSLNASYFIAKLGGRDIARGDVSEALLVRSTMVLIDAL